MFLNATYPYSEDSGFLMTIEGQVDEDQKESRMQPKKVLDMLNTAFQLWYSSIKEHVFAGLGES